MSADNFEVKGVSMTRFLGTDTGIPKINKEVGVHYESYKRLIALALRALEKGTEGLVPDPTVGENACQLRAGLYTEIFNASDFSTMMEESKTALMRVNNKLLDGKFVFQRPKEITGTVFGEKVSVPSGSVDHFFHSIDVDVKVDPRVVMIVAGFTLEMARPSTYAFGLKDDQVVISQHMDSKSSSELQKLGYQSKISVHNLAEIFKVALSEYSVKEAQRYAEKVLPVEESKRLLRMVSEDRVKKTAQGLFTAPCFSSSLALMHHVHRVGTPLIVRVHRVDSMTAHVEGAVDFFFKSEGGIFLPGLRSELACKRAAILCEAISAAHPVLTEQEVKTEMSTSDITEVILAFMATHPVYGGSLNKTKGDAEEKAARKPLKARALEIGCCIKNQRFCRPFHMLAVPTAKFINEENP